MEAGEVEFLAEKELVTITPNFSENKITLISVREATNEISIPLHTLDQVFFFIRAFIGVGEHFGQWHDMLFNKLLLYFQGEFGPFNPSMHSQVPLWLAVHLKQRQKCRIEPPDWMSVGKWSIKLLEWCVQIGILTICLYYLKYRTTSFTPFLILKIDVACSFMFVFMFNAVCAVFRCFGW